MDTSSDWNRDMSVGVAEVDVEHQLQARLVEALRDAVAGGRDRAVLGELLQRIEDTSNVHFMSEELLMRLHAWERYEPHTEEHRRLLEELRALRSLFERGGDAELGAAVEKLQAWLSSHIRGMDRTFAEHVARADAGPT
jgi:hemerythrin